MPCRQTHYKYDGDRKSEQWREEKEEGIKERNKAKKSSEDRMKERDHQRRESPSQRSVHSHLHSRLSPDAHRTATPAIKSNKFYSDLDGECRGNVQSDARWAAHSCDRVKPGCSSLAEDIRTCSYLPCGTIHRQVGHVASVCSSWSPVLEF